ncbi:hypothetical protein GCM10009730_51460 [Streptomyces albidochromogenes]
MAASAIRRAVSEGFGPRLGSSCSPQSGAKLTFAPVCFSAGLDDSSRFADLGFLAATLISFAVTFKACLQGEVPFAYTWQAKLIPIVERVQLWVWIRVQ